MKKSNEHQCNPPPLKDYKDKAFQARLQDKYEELYQNFNTIYHDDKMFTSLIDIMFNFYQERSEPLKTLDLERLKNPKWFCQNDSIGIQIYTEKFAQNLHDLENKLDYLQKLGVKFINALPFLDSPKENGDGGFAISDHYKIREDLGTIDDLKHLIKTVHDRNMCFCMTFIIHNTSDEHEWAKRAKNGEIEYQNRYHFFDSWYMPNQYDKYGTLGHFFGDIAPNNFTYVPECQKIVMTTFYPFQWDLNYTNPIVFNEIVSGLLYIMNVGIDVLLFNGCSCVWKKPGTSCRNLKHAYVINYIIFLILQIVCPGVVSYIDLKKHKNPDDNSNSNLKHDNENENDDDDDESESDNENMFLITESGVIFADENESLIEMSTSKSHLHLSDNEEEEEEEIFEFDQTKEIGNIYYNYGWEARLWASLALRNVKSISFSINAICNRFPGSTYFTRVQSHDDIIWGNGFDIESNSTVGNGLGNQDGYLGDIITLYRYLNDFYSGKTPGSFSKGFLFAEDMTTGKSRIVGRTASLLGLEKALNKKNELLDKMKNMKEQKLADMKKKLNVVENEIQKAINRIVLFHSVCASIPSIFFIYYGDEIGQLNDYSGEENSMDNRCLVRGSFNWDSAQKIDNDKESYQSKIFYSIKSLIDARLNFPSFTENKNTVFINSYVNNEYYDIEKFDKKCWNHQKEEIDESILIFKRIRNDDKFLIFIFNFCEYKKQVNIKKNDVNGRFRNIINQKVFDQINSFTINGYDFLWLEPVD